MAVVAGGGGRGGYFTVGHGEYIRAAVGENHVEHRSNAVHVPRDFQPPQDLVESGLQAGSHGVGPFIDRLVGQQLQGRRPGGCRERVGVEGAGVVDAAHVVPIGVAAVGNHVYDVGLAAHRAAGQPAGDYLGHGGQVGRYAVERLHPAGRGAEAGYHFVENQHYFVLRGEFPQALQIHRGIEGHLAHVGARRLQDERGNIVVALQGVLHRPQVAGGTITIVPMLDSGMPGAERSEPAMA